MQYLFFQAEDGIRDGHVTGVQTCALPIWPRRWAEAYLQFAAGEKRPWLRAMGLRFFPVVGWAERGDGRAEGHGNSVPRFHITWGTGPGVVEPFVRRLEAHRAAGRIHQIGRAHV